MITTWTKSAENLRVNNQEFSFLEMHMLRHVHPRKIILDVVGMIWAAYFLWNENWPAALLSVAVFGFLSLAFTWNIDASAIAKTTLGKLALLHLEPLNLALNLVGVVVLIYALWTHSVESILLASSIIILGHIQGWEKVNSALRVP